MRNRDKMQILYIVAAVALLSLGVSLVDAVLKPAYAPKVAVKIFCFLVIPMGYFLLFREEFPNFKKLFFPRRETMARAILVGLVVYGVILGGYFLTRGFVSFDNVTNTLRENHGITGDTFLYVSLYISLMNSFLEEFFFRGFGFLTLKRHVGRRVAYLFSPAMFALYHGGMLLGMFDWWVLAILFAGLFVGGCIFNWLNETGENIYTSWACHMFANFAINTVGFLLFGLL